MENTNYTKLYKRAVNAGIKRDYKKAVNLLTEILTNTDEFPHALLYLGRSYHALGEYKKAIPIYESYIKSQKNREAGHFFLGRTYLATGQYKRAIINLRLVLKKNQDFLPALSLLAIIFLKLRKPNLSVSYFSKAIKLDPGNKRLFNGYLNALLIKAIRLFHKNKLFESESVFKFIVEKRGNNILPHLYLARIYKEIDQDKLSLYHYNIVSELSPKDSVIPVLKAIQHLRLGDSEAAFKELRQSSILSNDQYPINADPELLIKFAAFSLFKQKRYKEAIFIAKRILKVNYKDHEMHGIIAEAYLTLGEFEKAKNHFTRCIEIEGKKMEYYHGLAFTLWELKEIKKLYYTVNKIKKLDPKDTAGHYFNTLCLSEIGESLEEIITMLQNEIRAYGPDFNLMFALGKSYLKASLPELSSNWFLRTLKIKKDHKESLFLLIRSYELSKNLSALIKTYSKYLELFSNDHNVRNKYMKILLKKKKYGDAAKELLTLLSIDVRNKKLKRTLASCYIKIKKYKESALILKELLRDEPKSIEFLRAFVLCLDKLKSYKSAISLLEKASRYMKGNLSILLPLGVFYSKEKNYEKAREIFRDIIGTYPKDWRAYQNLGLLYRRMGQNETAMQFLNRAKEYRKSS
jgi:tetratricopeptide (TPR) repeat protein